MRYVIVGAGAVGGTLAARLADVGREVVIVARGEHGRIIREEGLELAIPDRVLALRIPVVDSIEQLELRRDDALVLAVKSQDSASILPVIARLLVDGDLAGDVLPLFTFQNGVDNEPSASRYFAHVHGVSVALPATYLKPGHVSAEGAPHSGVFEIGRYPGGFDEADEHIARDLDASGFVARLRHDVMAWKRAKLLRNLSNAIDALVAATERDENGEDIRVLSKRARAEGVECFAAAGLSVTSTADYDDGRGDLMAISEIAGAPRGGSSTWQSLARGAGSVETDFLNGEIVRMGRAHGIQTPVNAELQRRMATLQGGAPGSLPLGELLTALGITRTESSPSS
jgi:2-dehydropantoate 2-reductase